MKKRVVRGKTRLNLSLRSLPMDGFRFESLFSDRCLGRDCTYRKGELLWSRQRPSGSVFVVKRGEVEIIVPGHKGHETVLRYVKPGEICGLFSLCVGRRNSAHSTARASVRTDVLEIACEEFTEFLRGRPDIAEAVLVTACDRLAFAEERVQVMAQRGAEDRLIALLLQLAARSGRTSPDCPELVRVQYTHSEMARMSGMNRAHVSLVLSRLRAKGLVRYGRGAPTQVNLPALLKYAVPQRAGAAPLLEPGATAA